MSAVDLADQGIIESENGNGVRVGVGVTDNSPHDTKNHDPYLLSVFESPSTDLPTQQQHHEPDSRNQSDVDESENEGNVKISLSLDAVEVPSPQSQLSHTSSRLESHSASPTPSSPTKRKPIDRISSLGKSHESLSFVTQRQALRDQYTELPQSHAQAGPQSQSQSQSQQPQPQAHEGKVSPHAAKHPHPPYNGPTIRCAGNFSGWVKKQTKTFKIKKKCYIRLLGTHIKCFKGTELDYKWEINIRKAKIDVDLKSFKITLTANKPFVFDAGTHNQARLYEERKKGRTGVAPSSTSPSISHPPKLQTVATPENPTTESPSSVATHKDALHDAKLTKLNTTVTTNTAILQDQEEEDPLEFEMLQRSLNLDAMPSHPKLVKEFFKKHKIRKQVTFYFEDQEQTKNWASKFKEASLSAIQDYYSFSKLLGEGSYGKVRLVVDRETKFTRACKIIPFSENFDQVELVQREIEIMRQIDHPNCIRTYEIFEDVKSLYIIMDYVTGGDLFDVISDLHSFSENDACAVMMQIISGVEYLHRHNIVHRDIKPENILCESRKFPLHVYLTDFGFSRLDTDHNMTTQIGTPFYMAPEILQGIPHGPPVDLFSCGIVCYALLTGKLPYGDPDEEDEEKRLNNVFLQIQEGQIMFDNATWQPISKEAQNFVKALLEIDPVKRITALDALNHPWFADRPRNARYQRLESDLTGLRFLKRRSSSAASFSKSSMDGKQWSASSITRLPNEPTKFRGTEANTETHSGGGSGGAGDS